MANIMSMTKLKNRVSRNGFDLSRKNLFTAKVGEMLPVACIECIPGDSFDVDMAWFTRTRPVNTAAYTRMREYYDWYFVPTNLLWNKFNTFVTQMTDNNQKATGINQNVKLTDEHPYFTFNQVVQYVQSQGNDNFFGFSRAELTCKLLHYLDYGDFHPFLEGSVAPDDPYTKSKLNPFPLLAYQKIYQDFIRDSQWEKAYAPASNIDYISGAEGTLNIPLSNIDKDNENMFDLRYYNWNKDYFMGLLPNSQYGDDASVILPVADDSSQGSFSLSTDETKIPNALSSMLFSGSPSNTSAIGVSDSGSQTLTYKIKQGGTVNNRAWFVSDDGIEYEPYLWLSQTTLGRLRDALRLPEYLQVVSPQSLIENVQSAFTILALRQAEAKQKWAEITQSQQQDYKSQVEAHFDVNVSDAYSDRCKYIGGVSGNVDIDPVQNQNITGENEADIAGRGQGGSRGSVRFETKVHGYFMCIYHCAPLLDFAIDGIKRQNLKTNVYDYAIPEFDATGMVSVPLVELTTSAPPGGGIDPDEALLGYAPRYIDYKVSYDLVHGGLYNGGLDNWVAPIDNNYIREYVNSLGAAAANGVFNYHFFKIPPSVLNPIFGVDVDDSVSTDQLLINCAFDIKAVRNLDRNGLPY